LKNLPTLVAVDIRALWSSPRYLVLVPLALAGTAAALWPYVGSPFLPLLAVLVFGTEPAFANLLFRSPRDLEATALLPLSWEEVVLSRNLATAGSAVVVFILMTEALVYTLPRLPGLSDSADALLWLGTLLFPLLHIGNELSVREPRRRSGWTFEDVARAGIFLAIGTVAAILHPLLSFIAGGPIASLLFLVAAAVYWRYRSIPAAAARIRERLPDLSMTP
jgi:hypothetical protein